MVLADGDTAPAAEPIRIMIVEDQPLVRFAAAEALRELGVSVVEAATADEAWACLQAGVAVDLVFTDHRMPGKMTGAELVARIHQTYPAIETVIASGFYDARERPTVIISKPYDLMEVAADLVRRVTNKKRGGTP